ncbi:hypothetical protein [Butyrivibrio sp. YAB3001]|uniref:hypothetical protein n=1 Tax=Butyrivibrio sp. YAB3001 TaxID=1520812 RepID=UPI0008F630EA|nr:hypothetical protein [Butyrivibrio sp. YAB3001]SFC59457.1 hypothetical protein SAMN02910398_02623 [Butyrivibrio sp. YAB3001]
MGGKVLDLPEIRIYKEGKAEGKEEGKEEGIRLFIIDKLEDGISEEVIIKKLQKIYSMDEKEAEDYYKRYSE